MWMKSCIILSWRGMRHVITHMISITNSIYHMDVFLFEQQKNLRQIDIHQQNVLAEQQQYLNSLHQQQFTCFTTTTVVCRNFLSGSCLHGRSCRFAHSYTNLPSISLIVCIINIYPLTFCMYKLSFLSFLYRFFCRCKKC